MLCFSLRHIWIFLFLLLWCQLGSSGQYVRQWAQHGWDQNCVVLVFTYWSSCLYAHTNAYLASFLNFLQDVWIWNHVTILRMWLFLEAGFSHGKMLMFLVKSCWFTSRCHVVKCNKIEQLPPSLTGTSVFCTFIAHARTCSIMMSTNFTVK